MATPTIYARVTREMKDAVDAYAEDQGKSLASAVTDLVARGLESASSENSVKNLEVRVQQLQGELSQIRQASSLVDGRLHQVLGTCQCGGPLAGNDLLVTGRCPACNRGVSGLLVGTDEGTGSVDRGELAPFLAGLGVAAALVALAYAASQ
jgi:hypothetical protein